MKLTNQVLLRLPNDICERLPKGRQRAAFIRDAIRVALDQRDVLTAEDRQELAQMNRLLRQSGVNLNQIARAMNAVALGGPDPRSASVEEAVQHVRAVLDVVTDVLATWERGL